MRASSGPALAVILAEGRLSADDKGGHLHIVDHGPDNGADCWRHRHTGSKTTRVMRRNTDKVGHGRYGGEESSRLLTISATQAPPKTHSGWQASDFCQVPLIAGHYHYVLRTLSFRQARSPAHTAEQWCGYTGTRKEKEISESFERAVVLVPRNPC